MTLEEAIKALADCYRMAGSDPTHMTDEDMAKEAVWAVTELRNDYTAACEEVYQLMQPVVIMGEPLRTESAQSSKTLIEDVEDLRAIWKQNHPDTGQGR